ncbi:MAG: neocarzinostatin apoprotein domain-containing protein [Acidimicrobiales bacterium]
MGVADVADVPGTAAAVPLGFGSPPSPPASRGALELSVDTDVHPGETVTVTGTGFRPGSTVDLFQCGPSLDPPPDQGACELSRATVVADGAGGFTTPYEIRGVISDPRALAGQGADPHDCVAAPTGACRIVAAEAVDFPGTAVSASVALAPPPVAVPGSGTIVEGDSGTAVLQIPITLDAPSSRTVTVDWTTVYFPEWTFPAAQPASDYASASGTATFAPGETVATADVTVHGDRRVEADELLVVSFRNPVNATLGGYWGLGFGTVIDDDEAGLVVSPSSSVSGGDVVTIVGTGSSPGVSVGWCQGVQVPAGVTVVFDEWCGVGVNGQTLTDGDGYFTGQLRLERYIYVPAIAAWVDCTAGVRTCTVGAAEFAEVSGTATGTPLEFAAPPPPPAARGVLTVMPAAGVAPDAILTVTGDGFRPGQVVELFQCAPGVDPPSDQFACAGARTTVVADGTGHFTAPFTFWRLVTDPRAGRGQGGTSYDCQVAPTGPCRVVAAEAVDFVGTAVAFDVSMAAAP